MEQPPSAREQIVELIDRYLAAVDDKRLDQAIVDATFAPGGKMVRPDDSELVGPKVICEEQNESFARFRATHHVITDFVVDMQPDRARVRANLTATHLWGPGQGDPIALESYFTGGGVLTVEVARLEEGWRIERWSTRIVWRAGSALGMMRGAGRPQG